MIDTTTAAVEIKRYCKQTGQMCELATDFGYCQLTACSKQKCGADMRETCNGDSCPMVQRWIYRRHTMAEYIDNGSIAVNSGDVLPLEVTNNCDNLFSVGTGIIFNADGQYLVTVYRRKIIVEKAVKQNHIKSEEGYPIVHARWIDLDDDFLCSACGAPWWHKENRTDKFRFCPNCGAKMDL